MPRRSVFQLLPAHVSAELNQRLVKSAFGDLVATAKWLTGLGYPIGKSQVGAYAVKLRREIEGNKVPRKVAGSSGQRPAGCVCPHCTAASPGPEGKPAR